jgi:uncharacterized protein YxjI
MKYVLIPLTIAALLLAPTQCTSSSPQPKGSTGCEDAPSYLDADELVIRERLLRLMPTFDAVTGNNCQVATMTREWLTFTRTTNFEEDGQNIGQIDTKFLSWGYDMTVRDQNGEIVNTIDHKLLESFYNFGGFYMEIADPDGKVVGVLKQDPFAIWNVDQWKYFEVRDPDTNEVIVTIEYTAMIPDTYKITNNSGISNLTLGGVVALLDQIEDEQSSSDDDDDTFRQKENGPAQGNFDPIKELNNQLYDLIKPFIKEEIKQ